MTTVKSSRLKVDALLPVRAADLPRARLLLRTLAHYDFPLAELTVVVPDAELAWAQRLVGDFGFPARILTDSALLEGRGEMAWWMKPFAGLLRRGWYRQQILKLGGAAMPGAPYVLILDADVLLARPVDASWFFDDQGRGKAVVIEKMVHSFWYRGAARALKVPRIDKEHGVTPALLHRETCRSLISRLQEVGKRSNGNFDWRDALGGRLVWSEYALYSTWARATGLWERHHHEVAYDEWFTPSVWRQRDWKGWSPGRFFGRPRGPAFSVVQSHSHIPVEHVAHRLDDALGLE